MKMHCTALNCFEYSNVEFKERVLCPKFKLEVIRIFLAMIAHQTQLCMGKISDEFTDIHYFANKWGRPPLLVGKIVYVSFELL